MRTVQATRQADPAALLALAEARANRFLANGTTTIEAKTGYGLDLPTEAKSFDVLRHLSARTPLRIIPTFLGAHVVPPTIDRAAYVRALMEGMLPAFKAQAVFCDAWCEKPAFTPSETRAILGRAKTLGYQLRIHAAQLAPGEGPEIAAELGARSADHLEFATPAQVKALAVAGTVATIGQPGSGMWKVANKFVSSRATKAWCFAAFSRATAGWPSLVRAGRRKTPTAVFAFGMSPPARN